MRYAAKTRYVSYSLHSLIHSGSCANSPFGLRHAPAFVARAQLPTEASLSSFASYHHLPQCCIVILILKEAVDFYYGEESSKVTVIKGEKSAVVFTPDTSEQSFFGCQNGKWKLPEYKLTRIVEKHQIDRNYYISTYHIGNEKGIYIIVTDQEPETSLEKKVVDSEGSKFIIPQKYRVLEVYCAYLREIPRDYSLKIDGYEVDVDWNNLLNTKEYPIFV